ncbi:hypothetical protein BH11MYX1_BH11MYX1_32440 [soil metagenome]
MNGEAPPDLVPDRAQLSAALRELENAKARVERDARQVADDTKKRLVGQLLPVLDNLDRTIKAAEQNGDAPAVIEGITLVKSQLEGVLRGYGVERFDAIGVPFDPAIHEAVTTMPVLTAEAHNLIVDQLAPGYRFGTQLLRPAHVVFGKLSQPAEPAVREPEPRQPLEPPPDAYGRPARAPQYDLYGRPIREHLDPYGRPVQFDRYGRPIRQAQPLGWPSPFTRRAR